MLRKRGREVYEVITYCLGLRVENNMLKKLLMSELWKLISTSNTTIIIIIFPLKTIIGFFLTVHVTQ